MLIYYSALIRVVAGYGVQYGRNNSGLGRGGFNGRPLVQWPTRPPGGWALEAPGLGGPGRLNFGLQLQSLVFNVI